jgi:putative ABC transport system permease protein
MDWNDLRRSVGAGTSALRAHRLRTALTTLGVVFGVAAVICMLAIGKGAEQRVLDELRRLGIHNLHVESRPSPSPGTASSGLVESDAGALVGELQPYLRGAAPERTAPRKAWVRGRGADVQLCGVTPEYAAYLDLETLDGRFIAPLDASAGSGVCVLSEPLVAELLPGRRAIGAVLRCGGQALRVVGVVRAPGLAPDARPPLYVPLALSRAMLPTERDARAVERIVVRLHPAADPRALGAVIETALARRHAGARDFAVMIPSELIRKEQRTQRIFQSVMGGIAGISLLVGGIGIANILFASVVERTSEIGLRRAVGARRRDVLVQFLVEAALIGAAGGIAGIVLGAAGAIAIGHAAQWPILVTPGSIVLSAGTALATGLVSGVMPARAAAHVDPIVALRHE